MIFLATKHYPVEYSASNLVPNHIMTLVNADVTFFSPPKQLKKKKTNATFSNQEAISYDEAHRKLIMKAIKDLLKGSFQLGHGSLNKSS